MAEILYEKASSHFATGGHEPYTKFIVMYIVLNISRLLLSGILIPPLYALRKLYNNLNGRISSSFYNSKCGNYHDDLEPRSHFLRVRVNLLSAPSLAL